MKIKEYIEDLEKEYIEYNIREYSPTGYIASINFNKKFLCIIPEEKNNLYLSNCIDNFIKQVNYLYKLRESSTYTLDQLTEKAKILSKLIEVMDTEVYPNNFRIIRIYTNCLNIYKI